MKFDNPRRAISLTPIVALIGAIVFLFMLSATSDASTGGWSATSQLTTSANASDVAIDPTTGKAEVIWVDGSSGSKSYWYAECDPTKTTGVCTAAQNLNTGLAPAPLDPNAPVDNTIDPTFNTSDALRPSIAVDNSGNIFVGFPNPAVGPGSGGNAYFRRKPHGGSFGPGVKLGSGWSVRLATDPSGNLHAVWGAFSVANYKKFAPGSTTPSITKSSFDSAANGATVATDSAGNAHLVWEDNNNPKQIQYLKIDSAGNLGGKHRVFAGSGNSINPSIAVDSNNRLQIAWRSVAGPGNIYYQSFDNSGALGSPNPASAKKISGGRDANEADVATIGANYFVTWQETNPSGGLSVDFFFGPTSELNVVDGQTREVWPRIAINKITGEISLVYMNAPGTGQNLLYRHRNCNCSSGPTTPTATGTATRTPTQTNTPTATNTPGGPTATRTNTPQPTNTVPIPPHGTPVNLSVSAFVDKAPSITVNGSGDIVVAWERDVSASSKDIFARRAPGGGAFGAAVNVSNSSALSAQPNLFNGNGSDVLAVFQEGNHPGYSTFHNGAWSAVTVIGNAGSSAQNVVGTQDTNGNKWVAWRNINNLAYDVWVLQIGGAQRQLSTSKSAASPAIVAGAGGNVYVGWLDKGPAGNRSDILVSQGNGPTWNALPSPGIGIQPSLGFGNAKLYAVFLNGTAIKQRIWNGSAWGATTTVATGTSPKTPKVFVTAAGNVFVVWSDSNKIYLSVNGGAKKVVSGTVASAKDPAISVDANQIPYIVFQNGEVWYVANP